LEIENWRMENWRMENDEESWLGLAIGLCCDQRPRDDVAKLIALAQ
jgi:hypothetical protein